MGTSTDDELDVIAGKKDVLIGKLQERYGMARQEAEREAKLARGLLTTMKAIRSRVDHSRGPGSWLPGLQLCHS